MVGTHRIKRSAIWVLAVLLWAFLIPGQFLQLGHDLQEIALHSGVHTAPDAVREQLTSNGRSHDCHSCLISHPRMSAHLSMHGSSTMHSEAESPLFVPAGSGFPGLDQEIPNKRSPPVQ